MKKKRYVGIDLGTTNSTVSIANEDLNGFIQAHTLDIEQFDESGFNCKYEKVLPSAVYVDEDGFKHIGVYSLKMIEKHPQRVLREVKRYMGILRDGKEAAWTIDNQTYTPAIVSSYVLKKLKRQVEMYLGDETVENVVITIPANFDFQQIKATIFAGELAGFDKEKIYTLAEPTAALLDYLNEEKKINRKFRRLNIDEGKKNLLVFDLGGGTCDVSILEVEENKEGKLNIIELSVSQYTELGGVDFDENIAQKILIPKLFKAKNITPVQFRTEFTKEEISKLLVNIKQISENAKKFFTRNIESDIVNNDVDIYVENVKYDNLTYRERTVNLCESFTYTFEISKKEYDDGIKTFLYQSASGKDIETPILNVLEQVKNYGIEIEDIDAVFLVGGMTSYHTIKKRIFEIFNNKIKPLNSINPMLSVSRGASIYNYYKNQINIIQSDDRVKNIKENCIIVKSIVPQNIYVEVENSEPVLLLEKGTIEGEYNLLEDAFLVSNVDGFDEVNDMKIELFSAENSRAMVVKELESATLNFRNPVKAGSKISLRTEFTMNREVIVSAWLSDDESEKIDVIIGESQLSDKEKADITYDMNIK